MTITGITTDDKRFKLKEVQLGPRSAVLASRKDH